MKDVALEPCPACHQPVHPVAGRCKHCRADLVSLRAEAIAAQKRAVAAARTAAATPLRVSMIEASAAPRPAATPRSTSSSTRQLALVAAAVLLLGVAGGVVAQKLYARGAVPVVAATRQAALDPAASSSRDPYPGRRFTDPFGLMPSLPTPDPDPSDPADPNSSDPFADPFFGGGAGGGLLDPFGLLRPRQPVRRAPRTPGAVPDVNDVQEFLPAMVDAVCDKLAQCGLFDGAAAGMCKMMADGLEDQETAERVRRGECHYDAAAARQCLQAVGGMTCDNAADPAQLLALADQVASCSRTLDCR